jgi:hypothetical protein
MTQIIKICYDFYDLNTDNADLYDLHRKTFIIFYHKNQRHLRLINSYTIIKAFH